MPRPLSSDELLDRVLDVLGAEHRGIPVSQIAALVGAKPPRVRTVLEELRQPPSGSRARALLEQGNRGELWRLSFDGHRAVIAARNRIRARAAAAE